MNNLKTTEFTKVLSILTVKGQKSNFNETFTSLAPGFDVPHTFGKRGSDLSHWWWKRLQFHCAPTRGAIMANCAAKNLVEGHGV